MPSENRILGFEEISEGVLMQSRKNPIYVRVVLNVHRGCVYWYGISGIGRCGIHHMRGWGYATSADNPVAAALLKQVAGVGGMPRLVKETHGIIERGE